MKKIISFLSFALLMLTTIASPVKNLPVKLVQPQGDTVHCFVSGDEFYHRMHDANDYTIVKNVQTGEFVYAALEHGLLVPTAYRPGIVNPALVGLKPGLLPDAKELERIHAAWKVPAEYRLLEGKTSGLNHGVLNNLVIFIRFSDEAAYDSVPFAQINAMFNDSTEGAVSMYSFYRHSSYHNISIPTYFYPTPSASGEILSYQDSFPRAYYQPYSVDNVMGYVDDNDKRLREFSLLQNAVNWINANSPVPTDINLDVNNDGRVDNLCFIVSGTYTAWSDLLWPHKWSLYDRNVYINGKRVYSFNLQLVGAGDNNFSVATLSHEMGHTLGCPDLYHYTHYLDVTTSGSWDLMDATQNPPEQTNSLFKLRCLNWFDSIPELTDSGTYTLQSLGSGPNNACKIASSNPDQWYILEYRNQADTFESTLPSSGLLVWRYNRHHAAINKDFDFFNHPHAMWLYRPGSNIDTVNGTLAAAAFGIHGRSTFEAASSHASVASDPYPYLSDGSADTSFALHNIAVSADSQSVSFTFVPYQMRGCDAVADFPLVQDFEDGLGVCWDFYSANTDNDTTVGVRQTSVANPAHGGDYQFVFSSWYSAGNYDQYLISPRLAQSNPLHLQFYYRRGIYTDQISVKYSTSGRNACDFVHSLGMFNVNTAGWHLCDLVVPDSAKYVAIKYQSSGGSKLYIDDISLTDTLGRIVRDTTYLHQFDTLINLVYDTVFTHVFDTLFRFADTNFTYVHDTVDVFETMHIDSIIYYEVPMAIDYYQLNVLTLDSKKGKTSGTGVFPSNTRVEIAGIPKTGYRFDHWSDGDTVNPRSVLLDQELTFKAYFVDDSIAKTSAPIRYVHDTIMLHDTVWTTVHENISLTVTHPVYIDVPLSWNEVVHDTTWIYHLDTAIHYYDRPMEVDTTVYYSIAVLSADPAQGVVAGNGLFPRGSLVQLGAVPVQGCHFVRWSDGNTTNPYKLHLDSDTVLTAVFAFDGEGIADVHTPFVHVFASSGDIVVRAQPGLAISVYNVLGQRVFAGIIQSEMRIRGLSAGVYLVRVGSAAACKVSLY